MEQIKEEFATDEELVLKAKTNTINDFSLAFEKVLLNKVIDRMDQNQSFFNRILDDEQFKNTLMDLMLVDTYEKLKK